jgi:ferredoxin-type protein NapH
MHTSPRWPGWLVLRRVCQLGLLAAFAGAPWGWGVSLVRDWGGQDRWVQGTLAASVWFGTLPLTDPLVLLQTVLAVPSSAADLLVPQGAAARMTGAGGVGASGIGAGGTSSGGMTAAGMTAGGIGAGLIGAGVIGAGLLGALLVALPLALLSGRLYCAWVCPINLVTDFAELLRRVSGWHGSLWAKPDRRLRHVVLVLVLIGSAATGTIVWETLNPITATVRAFAFGLWAAGAAAVIAVLLIDLLVLRRGWCGHLCPVGAFYAWLGRFGRLHVSATRAGRCTQCGDCYARCPEPHVIVPVLPAPRPRGGVTVPTTMRIASIDCLRCGRCIDACPEGVFEMRLTAARPQPPPTSPPARPMQPA